MLCAILLKHPTPETFIYGKLYYFEGRKGWRQARDIPPQRLQMTHLLKVFFCVRMYETVISY